MMETHWIVDITSVMFLMPTQEFGGTVMMTTSLKVVILPKGVYIRESHKIKEKVMSGSTDVLFVVYIRTSHLKNAALFIFRNSHPYPKS